MKIYNNILTNPFSDNSHFHKLNSSYICPDVIVKDSERVFTMGNELYLDFRRTLLIIGLDDLTKKKINKILLKLSKDANDVEAEKPRIAINDKLVNKLRDAYDRRPILSKKVFQGEWTGIPECFVKKDCKPYHNTKSLILDCISNDEVNLSHHPNVEALIVDFSVAIRAQASVVSPGTTFNDLSESVLQNKVKMAESCDAQRIDIASDHYTELSIKSPTRLDRKSKDIGQQMVFDGDTLIPDDKSFLTDENNKSRLNAFIIQNFINSSVWDKEFCCSNGVKNVITNTGEKEIYNPAMMNSVLEEADNRIVCHIFDMVQNHVSHISIRTADSDVIVIILGFMQQLIEIKHDITVLVDFKSSTPRKIISLNTIFSLLGSQICSSLPFFSMLLLGQMQHVHSSRSQKKEWFKCLIDFPLKDHLTTIFQQLTKCPNYEDVTDAQPLLQQFLVFVYLKNFETIDIDELRCNMFQNSSSKELRVLPPSKDALQLHVFRSAYQAGWIWGNSMSQLTPPLLESWGWRLHNGELKLRWKSFDTGSDLMKATTTCQCRTEKCKACKCAKSKIHCLKFCNCARKFGNI